MPSLTYQQVRDVLERIRKAHQRLRDSLEAPRARAPDSRTRHILLSLRHEEQTLQITLAKHLADGSDPVLNTWLQYVPVEDLLTTLESIEFTPSMSADEVVAVKQEFDHALMTFLRQLAEETAVPRVREFFASLLREIETRTQSDSWQLREFQGDETPPRITK